MSSESEITKRRDLVRVAEAYLAGQVSLRQFTRNLSHIWSNLSRMALSDAEALLWADIVLIAEELEREAASSQPTHTLFDERLLRHSVAVVLGRDTEPSSSVLHRRACQVQQAIATVLLSDWDPIGINDVPEAADEYNSCIGGIYRLMASGTTPEELAQYLRNIEVDRMGIVRSDPDALLPVARRLLTIDVRLEAPSV